MTMPRVRIADDSLSVGRLSITFQRTLRIPDDGRSYPLPPGLGAFPLRRVKDFARRVPAAWRERGGYFIPMYQREALWISFRGERWRPNAVKVGVGGVNAISGQPWDERLRRRAHSLLPPKRPAHHKAVRTVSQTAAPRAALHASHTAAQADGRCCHA